MPVPGRAGHSARAQSCRLVSDYFVIAGEVSGTAIAFCACEDLSRGRPTSSCASYGQGSGRDGKLYIVGNENTQVNWQERADLHLGLCAGEM